MSTLLDQTLLMCRNVPVYNIDTAKVLTEHLLPGYMGECTRDNFKFEHSHRKLKG